MANKNAKTAAIVFAAVLVFVPVITVIIVKTSRTTAKKTGMQLEISKQISEEQLFIPAEPDFIPEILLEHERRETWAQKDADPFWTDMSKYPKQFWKDRLTRSLDKLLESVP